MNIETALENHRKMWSWIANKSLEEKRKVEKKEYFIENNINKIPFNLCYCCECSMFDHNLSCYKGELDCKKCPINWSRNKFEYFCSCIAPDSLYTEWKKLKDSEYKEAYEIAKKISELPEREGEILWIKKKQYKDAEICGIGFMRKH